MVLLDTHMYMYAVISPAVTSLIVIFLQLIVPITITMGRRFGDNVRMLNYNCHRYDTRSATSFSTLIHTRDITIYDNVMHL